MTTAAVSGHGTKFMWHDGTELQEVAELSSISGPTQSAATIDVTSHDSAGWREFIAGLREGGSISIEGNLIVGDADGQVGMYDDFDNGEDRAWEIRFPSYAVSAPKLSGTGIIESWTFNFPSDDKITFSASIKLSGAVTYTPVVV